MRIAAPSAARRGNSHAIPAVCRRPHFANRETTMTLISKHKQALLAAALVALPAPAFAQNEAVEEQAEEVAESANQLAEESNELSAVVADDAAAADADGDGVRDADRHDGDDDDDSGKWGLLGLLGLAGLLGLKKR